jgi:hypothetical protein
VTPFGAINDARTAFAAIWTVDHQNEVVGDLQAKLLAEVTRQGAATIRFSTIDLGQVCREVFSFLDSPAIQQFCLRLLMTPAWGPGSPTFSDLLVHVFVQLEYLGHAIEWRDQQDAIPILSQQSGWPKTRHANVNGLACFLPMVVVRGANQDMKSFERSVEDIDAENCPLFAMVAYPILRLVQGFFPGDFRYEDIRSRRVNVWVRNSKSKLTDEGVYSQSFLQDCIDNHTLIRACGSSRQMYYPLLRVLSLDAYQFSTAKSDPMQLNRRKEKDRDEHMHMTAAEETVYRNYDPIVITPAWLVHGAKTFRAARLWQPPVATTRARRRRAP